MPDLSASARTPSSRHSIRPLGHGDFPAVFDAFATAFSDYVVPFRQTPDRFREMLTRRGYVPELSLAAFEDGRIVGFTLTGTGSWKGKQTAYDTGTGVIPSHRARGLGSEIFRRAIPVFQSAAIQLVLLEVLSTNTPAIRLYRNFGFRTERRLLCWSWDADATPRFHAVRALETVPWADVERWHEAPPSWQNARESIVRAPSPPAFLGIESDGRLVGYAIVFASGDLAQLAVDPEFRRRGVGSEILRAARRFTGTPLRIVNVDSQALETIEFLRHVGATMTVEQWEMTFSP